MYRKSIRNCPKQRSELFKHCVPCTQMMTLSITMAQCSDPGGYIRSSQFKMQKPELDHVYPLVKFVTRTGECACIAHVGLGAVGNGNRLSLNNSTLWMDPSRNSMMRFLTTECRGQAAVARSHDVFSTAVSYCKSKLIAVQEWVV